MGAQKYQPTREGQDKPSGSEASERAAMARQVTAASERPDPITTTLMEKVVRRENLIAALKRVRANKGSPGIDGMTVEELGGYLREQWPRIREELLRGDYQPQLVEEVSIPKPEGGIRRLGIPTVLDRFIQQALLQVLTPIFDSTFSPYSYGFRPGRNAHEAVRQAKKYIAEGYELSLIHI